MGLDFQGLFEAAPAAILVLDPDLNIVAVTEAYLKATMTRRDAIVGRPLFEVFPDDPDDPEADGVRNLRASLDSVRQKLLPHVMAIQKYSIRRPDSEEFEERHWSPQNIPLLAEDGSLCLILHCVEDVTEKVRLGKAEGDLERFFNLSLDMLCIASGDGYFKRVSPAFREVLGWSPAEMCSRPFLDFVHPDDVEATQHEVARQVQAGESVLQFENRYRRRDGEWRTLSWKSMPQPDGLLFATARDVTEKQEHLRELEAARIEAERANVAKSEFLSRMSHELRTPMNAVIGYAQLLELSSEDPKTREYAEAILKGGRHLLSLINEILDLARIEAGKLTISLEPVSVDGAIRQAIELIRPTAEGRGITIEQDVEEASSATVNADRQRLVQVLVNLLSNATKFNRPDGKIAIRGRRADPSSYRVEISDTGMGIDPSFLSELFKPFERLGNDTAEGTGLGLALSKNLVQLMGGSIDLLETGPKGTTFALNLRTAANPAAIAPLALGQHLTRLSDRAHPLRIVYIEDNPSNIKLMETLFSEVGGAELKSAADGATGLELVAQELPDVVFLDLHLPDMHGYEVLARIKGDPKTEPIPVIVISADATRSQIKRMLGAGAFSYLTKPIDFTDIFAELEAAIMELDAAA